jgi:hypothetical protein
MMIHFKTLGVAAVLSAAIAAPLFAQPVVQEPGNQAFYYPNSDLGIGSPWPRLPSTTNAMASSPMMAPAPVRKDRAKRGGSAGTTR